ncbi:4-oxalocrotonate tautomerase [Rhodococcus pyridinivorans KG-16]|uniref:4-oxalocrotonate tautomerase n=1 Tax=Rhodococcus pyridinivorans KG-16 TaxID=1441730 RepID=A0A0V9UF16_9NOCA|nr:tautomerase family protein [Rhodococcus pyridinivorans]KSZ56624.1 4-oxalocrotonate tautomerase [Rhodococcus pyridinivorans KG-16]
MPVVHFHLPRGVYSTKQRHRLLISSSRSYAEILGSPVDRVRSFILAYEPDDAATAGQVIAHGGACAPYFTAVVLAGRSVEQRRTLAARFTDLIVEILSVPRELVRGHIVEADPENWYIAGIPAATARADELAARASTPPAP